MLPHRDATVRMRRIRRGYRPMSIHRVESTIASAPPASAAVGFRASGTLTRWLVMLLWANIILSITAGVSGLFELNLLKDIEAGVTLAPGQAEANDLRQQAIAIVHLA